MNYVDQDGHKAVGSANAFKCIVMLDYGDAPKEHETVREGINWYHEMNRMRREKNEK